MGDSGSMVLGLVFAGSAITITGNVDPVSMGATLSGAQRVPLFIPLLLPVAVVLLPLLDMAMAVVRRLAAGKSPFHPDRMHLHHRMLALGHSHRRAVLILYVWAAVFSFGVAALVLWDWKAVLAGLAVAVVVALLLTLGPLRTRGRFLDDDVATGSHPAVAAAHPAPVTPRTPTPPAVPPAPTLTTHEGRQR